MAVPPDAFAFPNSSPLPSSSAEPAPQPAITFAVRQANAFDEAVARTVASLALMSAPTEIVVELSSPALQATLLSLPLPTHVRLICIDDSPGSPGPWTLASGGYLCVVSPGDVVLDEGISRALAALEAAPDAAAHLSAAVLGGQPQPAAPQSMFETIPVGDPAWSTPASSVAGLADGRLLARRLLLGGVNRVGPSAAIIFRRSVVPAERVEQMDAAPLPMLLDALCRGPLLIDPAPSVGAAAPTVETLLSEIEQGPGLIRAAIDLGLLEDQLDAENAIRDCREAGAHLLAGLIDAGIGLGVPSSRIASTAKILDQIAAGLHFQSEVRRVHSRDWIPALASKPAPSGLRFVIIAPAPYSTATGGAVAIHRLCDRLVGLGEDAVIFPWYQPPWTVNLEWHNSISREVNPETDVIIYPECFVGNPLGARRVVRWLLLRPGLFTGGTMMQESDSDLAVTFNRMIDPTLPELAVPIIDPTIFYPKESPGSGKLLWIGKGRVPADLDRSDLTLITRNWPAGRERMAEVLRAADVLYTCDWCSAVIGEAQFCGTPVVMVGEQLWTKQDVLNVAPDLEGFSFDDGPGLELARETVKQVYPNYLAEVARTDQGVAEFVALAKAHFASLEAPVA